MIVICKNFDLDDFTYNREYKVQDLTMNFYIIENDKGKLVACDKNNFQIKYASVFADTYNADIKNIDIKYAKLVTTITEECKKECGNIGNCYDGIWEVKEIDYRNQEVSLSNGRVSISKKFTEITPIVIA